MDSSFIAFLVWLAWMIILFFFWRFQVRSKERYQEAEYQKWLERFQSRQPHPNTASYIEMGDLVCFEYKDRQGELRKIRLVPQAITDNFYIGDWFLGHFKGDQFKIPDQYGYREITIISIDKGKSNPSDN